MKNKISAIFLIIFMLAVFIVSCGDNNSKSGNETESGKPGEETIAPEAEKTLFDVMKELPERNFEGYEFIIITREEANIYWYTRDVFSAGSDGEPINDAVYERNMLLEERYNIKIKDLQASAPAATAKTLMLANDDAFTAVTDGIQALAVTLAKDHYLADYNTMPGIKLENPWWDQAMVRDMSIMHRLYFVTGDISIMDNEGTWNILFNKDIITNFTLESPYDLVNSGKWTLTKMHEHCKAVSADVDGDGKMTHPTDRFGLATEEYNNYSFWVGGGMKITAKDKDDLPYLTMYSEKSVNVLEKALALNLDKNITMNHNIVYDQTFSAGNILYQLVGMRVHPVNRQYDINYGILPLPKYDEAQDQYYTTFSAYNLTAYSVPITATNMERTGILLEAMAAVSYYTLTPAYYEISLKGKMLRDNESGPMMDMILANRAYDMGLIFNWGGTLTMFTDITNASGFDFTSKYNALEERAKTEMAKFIEEIS
ncbi:MAG: hypothetical protein FWF15_05590 [Oscillospiraceae bacterium]|nr:hypothetical protein [Oscillospiraceae bacterium]